MIMTKVNTLSKLVLICGLTAATLSTGSVFAKGDGYKQGHSEARFLLSERAADKLALTQEQQTQLKAIFTAQKAQIKGDLKEGEQIVNAGMAFLHDGQKVTLIEGEIKRLNP